MGVRNRWKRWKQLNRAQLDRCGVPEFILDDENRWLNFLQEGGWDAESGFKLAMIQVSELEQLEQLLRTTYGGGLASAAGSCLAVLRKTAAERRM